jgi:hypothetical protein
MMFFKPSGKNKLCENMVIFSKPGENLVIFSKPGEKINRVKTW